MGGMRPAAVLATLRGVADEIIVAVDSRAPTDGHADLAAVADRLIVYPYAGPVDRVMPWLFNQARGDWVFLIDDDEIPSVDLIEGLPGLLADESVVHVSLQIGWLYPDAGTYLAEWPWQPHYAARLLRRDTRLIRFSDETHRSVLTAGPGRFVDLVLWHADALLRTREERLAKAAKYESDRPGLRIAGRALNVAFYVPELWCDPMLEALPDSEREHVEAVLGAGPQAGDRRAALEIAEREEIDRFWPLGHSGALAGRLELLDEPHSLTAGEERKLEVLVHNTGATAWAWGEDAVPEVRVGARWYDVSGAELAELEIHTPLAAPLAPGEHARLPVHVRAPEAQGRYRVHVDLIQEHVKWFDVGDEREVAVQRQRRIAVTGDDETVGDVAAILQVLPELEIVRLRRTPSATPGGYREAPDYRGYLFDDAPSGRLGFTGTLLWRRLRLRLGPTPTRARETVDALLGAELLVLGTDDGPDERRERFARGTLARSAKALGLKIAETHDPDELVVLLRRLHGPPRHAAVPRVPRGQPEALRQPPRP
jgi:hypothetical protein